MALRLPIYMDNHATTPCDPRVFEAMAPYFTEMFGNAHSRSHRFGWQAEEAVETARKQVATLIGASPKEIAFTSGATESDNLAIKGVAWAYRERGDHVVSVVTEHKAVLDSCKRIERQGFRVTLLPVSPNGLISLDQLEEALTGKTVLVSVMMANNEIGVIQPVAEIGKICNERGILFHSDATQAIGKVPFDVDQLGVDLVSITAHKMYGPKGAGALYVRNRGGQRVKLTAMMDGGGQERGMRSGTLNVTGIVGLGKAAELAKSEMSAESAELLRLRERLRTALQKNLDEVRVNGDLEHRLPGNLSMSFASTEGEALIMGLNDIALSSGAACTSASIEPSHVLKALGVSGEMAHSTLRFGLGRFNTEEEVNYTIGRVTEIVRMLREVYQRV